jgi:hypothetical protein
MLKDSNKKRRSSNYNLRYSVVTRGAAQAKLNKSEKNTTPKLVNKEAKESSGESYNSDVECTVEYDKMRKECINQMMQNQSISPAREQQREPA